MSKPTISLRAGAVQLALWENENGHTAKLVRRYKDKQSGEWRDAQYLYENDLLVASELLRLAWEKVKVNAPPRRPADDGAGEKPQEAVPW